MKKNKVSLEQKVSNVFWGLPSRYPIVNLKGEKLLKVARGLEAEGFEVGQMWGTGSIVLYMNGFLKRRGGLELTRCEIISHLDAVLSKGYRQVSFSRNRVVVRLVDRYWEVL